MDAELREQPIAQERAQNADDEIANYAESATVHQLPREPPRYYSDENDYDESVI